MGDRCKVLMISHRWVLEVGCWMLMISHRGISVITPLPFGGGDGGGAITCFEPCVFCSSVSSVRKRMFLRESENSKHPNRNCQNFSVVTPFSVWGKAKLDMRRCSSAFKKVPFLRVKDALLDARRASSLMLCVMGWFVVGYKVGYWRYYTPVLKMIT